MKNENDKRSYLNIFLKLYFFISLILLTTFLAIFLNTGFWSQHKNQFVNRLYGSSINHYANIFEIGFNAFRGVFYNIPEINISIHSEDATTLENDRNKAKKTAQEGMHYNFSEVPVRINYKNNSYNADLRLKGDRKIHFDEKKHSSYKINLKGEGKIFNVEKFSLMKPRARNYIHEWIFHELIGEGGLIKLKYKFIDLKINGNYEGLYVLEESFGKILLERNKRTNGPIFSIYDEFSTTINDAKFQIYDKKHWLNEENIKTSNIVYQKLKDFFEDRNNSDEILDMDKWAWFYAVADINDYYHGLVLGNLRFYYNFDSEKFEPVAFDGHRLMPNYNKRKFWFSTLQVRGPSSFEIAQSCKRVELIKRKSIDNLEFDREIDAIDRLRCPTGFSKNMYKIFYNKNGELNLNFYNKYRNAVLQISSNKFLDTFFKKREKQIKQINSKIYGDYFLVDHLSHYGPGLYYFTENNFYHKADYLVSQLIYEPGKIFIHQDGDRIIIENKSINNSNLAVKQILCNKKSNNGREEIMINVDYGLIGKINEINLTNYLISNFTCTEALIIDKNNNNRFSKLIDPLNRQ